MTRMKHTMAVAAAVLLAATLTACGDDEPTPMENCLASEGSINADPEAVEAGLEFDAEEFCTAAREADPASFDEWYAEPRD